jgi:hypothetical protein
MSYQRGSKNTARPAYPAAKAPNRNAKTSHTSIDASPRSLTFVDDNGISTFVDDLGVSLWVDDNGTLLGGGGGVPLRVFTIHLV